MILLLPVFAGIATVITLTEAATVQYYATKYDHLDVETLLNNRRMVNHYAACLLSKGPCPPEGLEFKRILPEALRTNCLKCTEKQKTVTLRAIKRLRKEYPKVWSQLAQQWDPDEIQVKKFEASFGSGENEIPAASVQIQNRFSNTEGSDKNKDVDNAIISQIFTTPSSTSPATSTLKTTSTSTSKPPSTITTRSTTPKVSSTAVINNANINIITGTTTKPTKRPRPNLQTSIQATVSLGPKLVGEFVRGLGAIGTRVVETGAEIAGVVLKNIVRPL